MVVSGADKVSVLRLHKLARKLLLAHHFLPLRDPHALVLVIQLRLSPRCVLVDRKFAFFRTELFRPPLPTTKDRKEKAVT